MKRFFAFTVLSFITCLCAFAQQPTAKVQLAHNAADLQASVLDIYVNDELYLDDFPFRTATEFRDFAAGTEVRIGIARASSQSASDVIVNFTYTFVADSRNVLMINGVLLPSDFAVNPDPNARPINIMSTRIGDVRETGFIPSQVDVLMWHGISDLGAIDLVDIANTKHVSALSYGFASEYFRVFGGVIPVSLRAGDSLVETYQADFGKHAGEAILLVASGFYRPELNKDGPSYGLYFISNEGGPFDRLPPATVGQRGFVQFVNNSADVDHKKVDVWINDTRVAENLEFRKATPYVQVTPNVDVTVSITEPNSVSQSPSLVSKSFMFTSALHMLVLNGLVSTEGYAANDDPSAQPIGIDLHHVHDVKPGTTPDHVEMFAVNGATDAPAMNIAAVGSESDPFFQDISFGEASSYASLPLDSMNITVMRTGQTGSLGVWHLDCSTFAGKAVTLVASGFVNPSQNKNGERLELMLVFDDGQTALLRNTVSDVESEFAHALSDPSIAPNPTSDRATVTCDLPSDAAVTVTVYNSIGVRVAQSAMGLQPAGYLHAELPTAALSSGMYHIVVEAGAGRATIPLRIVR